MNISFAAKDAKMHTLKRKHFMEIHVLINSLTQWQVDFFKNKN